MKFWKIGLISGIIFVIIVLPIAHSIVAKIDHCADNIPNVKILILH